METLTGDATAKHIAVSQRCVIVVPFKLATRAICRHFGVHFGVTWHFVRRQLPLLTDSSTLHSAVSFEPLYFYSCCPLLGQRLCFAQQGTALLQVWHNQPECLNQLLEKGVAIDLQDGESGW